MKKILVTGGAGFIGSHLCERLSKNKNYQVFSLDNYFTGSEENHVKGVVYIKGSTVDIDRLITIVPDIIYHLGEYSRVEQSFDDIEKVVEFNKIGTIKVLEFVRKTRAKLIYAGSSTKFGDGGSNANASPYAWSKSSNTQLVKNYCEWFGIDYAITYFYNVYGPREIKQGKYATLIALFEEKIKNAQPLTVVSPGTQKRNFTHIEDTVEALLLIGEKGQGDEYGIGNPKSYSVLEVAKMFGGEIMMIPERRGNRITAEVISDKTIKLGWKPKKCLSEYVSSVVMKCKN
ncbi:NAD-dependent epimerase/dehydratase family protein [Allofrancisella guangzhouensis]|uniref:ADP-L-glycero-D-manno-heptose-6-epimerase n=1 Tax=Allofrancisella guangzhouensis TaxID=594679 RepID=A0A0A8EAX0_9GAMM|nr:NAD-dependent epimerase/dehydratase family protein [Allofrancisella guangzhouensis]AJC49331.1 ADP-L-glycero-D-manno-heptose-6-epimerase [Allofrancisella guangzhouensis]MBK2043942.1 NAD-dependent epimerase/dehydratase family protein [Allofrancisella guangzhouensis]MBK2044945.1 NAD-dependent epimerase/dehydratase family protein [Allofrancisella guangzhouensis]